MARKTNRASGAPSQPLAYNPNMKFTCDECGKGPWNTSSALARHKQTHAKSDENRCKVCDKLFAQRTALNTHKNIHTGERPFVCRRGCNKPFSDPSSRGRHEKEIHCPAFGYKCLRTGCKETFKRKNAFAAHMMSAHDWEKGKVLPNGAFEAAKSRHAREYYEEHPDEHPEQEPNANGTKSLFNAKRPHSASPFEDQIMLPPAKKQSLYPSPPRRNAVGSIEAPTPQHFAALYAGHKSNADDRCASAANSLEDAFSGAYHTTGHEFTNSSPTIQSFNSDQSYQEAMDRVNSPGYSSQRPVTMPPGPSGYGVAPSTISPRAPMMMPEPIHYQYSNPVAGIAASPSWSSHDGSYGSQWSVCGEVAQTHGVNPTHMAHEDPPARGILPPSRSDLPHAANNNGINLSNGGHQNERLSGSPPLDPRLGQAYGSFRDHQVLTRTPSEHSNSPRLNPHMQGGTYELGSSGYGHHFQGAPRSVDGGGRELSYH